MDPTPPPELASLLEEARQRLDRIRQIEAESEQLVQKLRARLQALAPRPLKHRLLFWLARLAGVRLGTLFDYPARPVTLPAHYAQTPLPANPPTIALVTPSYNQGKFLERTLLSVLEQGYPALEYVVQDGGSQDQTAAVLKKYADRLTHCESAPDGGQSQAINLGFRHTTGEIMAFLNSDDVLLPGSLAYVGGYFTEHPEVDVIYGHRVLIDEHGGEVGRWVMPPHCDEVLRWVDFVPQETLFWRRRIWERAGGAIDESFRYALDWDLLLRFREAGARFVRVPRFLGGFRLHTLQKTQHLNEVGQEECRRLRQRLHGRDVTEAEILRRIRPYVLRHAVCHRLYRLGLVRY
jgi:glycosyltransferase involved in cell wall biosynthesis